MKQHPKDLLAQDINTWVWRYKFQIGCAEQDGSFHIFSLFA